MVSNQDAKNLLVNWLNKNQSSNVQTNLNKNSATNVVDPTLTNTNPVKDLKSWTKDKLRQKNVITAPAQNFSIKNNIQPTNNSGAGNVVNTPIQQPVQQQSRFIGFQNQQQQETNPIYIQPEDVKANMQNLRENIKHRTNSQALMEFQSDVYKNKGKMSKDMMTRLYPEFKDNIDVLDELQKELRPIVQDGYGVDSKQLENLYPELLQAKKLQNLADVKTKSEEANKKYETVKKKVDDALRSNIKGLSSSGLKFARDADMLFEAVETAKQRGVEGGANDNEILSFLIQNSPEAQQIWNEMNSLELTKHDRGILGYKDAGLRDELNAVANVIKDASGLTFDKATDEEIETAIKGKEALEKDFWGEVGKKISVELGVSLDSIEKGLYRNYKDWQNVLLEKGVDYAKGYITKDIKSDLEKSLGVKLTDEQVDEIKNLYEEKSKPIIEEETRKNKQNVLDYQESVNKEYESRRARLNQDIENYVNNGSMTSSLLQGDLSSFLYKSSGEAAQNVDNLLMVVGGTVAPEVVLPAMFADSYLRESQESFEELMKVQEKMGITGDEAYDNAQKGSATVGLASSLVEVGLEKVLGGVETTASKAFHDMLMKDFTEKATKMVAEKGLMELLKQGATTQFKASLEEGLEEVFQQAIHNKALQKYDPDQKITEGMLEAFEGGFYNWMNLLAGGGNVMSNIEANQETIKQGALQGAYNAGVQTRKAVDTATDIYNSVKNKVTAGKNKVTNNQTNVETNQTNNVGQNTAITPVNNNIQAQDNEVVELQDDTTATENKNTVIKEGGLTDKVLEQLNGLDENTRERIKKNPYSVQEAKDLIDEMENNPGIDFRDYQNGRYEEVLNEILNKLEQKENKRKNDIGSLYDKLEQSNAQVDVTELKNKVAEFEAQAEALGDIITPAEQGQIKTILKNINEIGDGTMDVWKARRIADKWTKGSLSSSYDGIGLIREIRDTIDSVIREQNPDMKEVDKSYRKVLNEISEIKGKLFYKKGGQVKSNAVSTVKNMLNASNRMDLNNLEKYLPGIKDQLQAIDDSKFVYNAYTTGKGSRFISGIARGVFGNLGKVLGLVGFGWAGLITGAVIDAAVDKAMVSLTRKALKETITQETEKSKAELERINKKIEEGKKLDAEDKARLKELGEKIMANAEKMADTKAEKEAVDKMKGQNKEKNQVTKKKATKKNKVTEKKVEKKAETEKAEPKKEENQTKEVETKQEVVEKKEEKAKKEQPKNKVTAKKTEATTPKQETKVETKEEAKAENKSDGEHFDYGTYGDVLNKIDEAEKEIKAELDKQYEKERAEKMKRFEYLRDKEDKTDAEGKELVKLAGELNNMTNKYERLLEQEMEKKHPDLLKEKEKQQKMFDKDWAEMWERKMAEMNKPYKELYDKYMGEIKKIIGFDENEELTKEIYDKLELSDEQRAEVKRLEEERQKEYDKVHEEKVKEGPLYKEMHKDEELRQKTASIKKIEEESKTKITENKKNKVTNPTKSKETSLFNENEVDKGNKSEGLNPDALPLQDYKEMQRLENGRYNSLGNALRHENLGTYMATKIATDLVGDYNEIIEDERDPDNLEDRWVSIQSDIEEMYEMYEDYLEKKAESPEEAKLALESADDLANKVIKGKTAKELIDQYNPDYQTDLKIYKRLLEKYPNFYNGKIDLTGLEGKARREFSNQVEELAKDRYETDEWDMDYQELAELENITPQITDAEIPEEEMNKVTKRQPEKPKNLVTSKTAENTNTEVETAPATTDIDSQSNEIWQDSIDNLKKGKYESKGALGKMKTYRKQNADGSTISYFEGNGLGGETKYNFIVIYSPEGGQHNYTVEKKGDQPATVIERGRQLTDEEITKLNNILKGKKGEVEVKDTKIDMDNVEDKKDPINAFLDNNEAIKNDPKLKYKYLSRLNDQTSWIDYSTDIRYNGTVAEKVQQTIDSFGKLSNGTRLPIKFSKNNYGNYIEVGDLETGLASRNIGDDIEFEYAKFLYDNPEIRSTKEIKADGLKEAIKKGNEIHKEVVKDAEELKEGLPLDPEKYVWQQPTADEGIEAVYNETKKISDYFEARKESEKAGNPYGYGTEYREKVKAAQNALWSKLKFKSDRSKLYQDFVKNIRESNGNEKQLRSIAKNLYIQKVKDDFKNNYNYPTEVTDKVPGLRTAKDNYDRYLKGRDTSFSGKDPRIDYSDRDRIGAGIKRQDGNQITAEQRREIVNGVLEYAKYMGIDMKKMSEDAGVTYVHLNGKHPFLTSKAVGLFHGTFKSISVGADMESYREKMGQSKDAKTETHTVPVVMAHEITHAIDSMFEWSLFSDQKTREMGRKMNEGRSLGAYWHSKEEITARMVEEYVDVMKGGKGYYNMRGYWNKDVFDNEIKPYVEQIFDEKFNGYKLTAKERNDIKLDEAPTTKNTVTASDLNKVTNKVNAERVYSPTITVRLDENGNVLKNSKNKVTSKSNAATINNPTIRVNPQRTTLENNLKTHINEAKAIAKNLGYTISQSIRKNPVKVVLDELSEINGQMPKGDYNKLTDDEKRLYDKKADIVQEVMDGIDNRAINGNYRWGIDTQKKNKPGIIITIGQGNKEWKYHFLRGTDIVRRIRKKMKLQPF